MAEQSAIEAKMAVRVATQQRCVWVCVYFDDQHKCETYTHTHTHARTRAPTHASKHHCENNNKGQTAVAAAAATSASAAAATLRFGRNAQPTSDQTNEAVDTKQPLGVRKAVRPLLSSPMLLLLFLLLGLCVKIVFSFFLHLMMQYTHFWPATWMGTPTLAQQQQQTLFFSGYGALFVCDFRSWFLLLHTHSALCFAFGF